MLPRANRFSFKKGAPRRFFLTSAFRIAYSANEEKGLHVAVVVGKKIDKGAVGRNKIKRSIVGIIKELVSLDTNYDIVIFVRKEIYNLDEAQKKEELRKFLKEIHII